MSRQEMKVIGLAGWSGSGKTTLIVQLIPALVQRGLKVSTTPITPSTSTSRARTPTSTAPPAPPR